MEKKAIISVKSFSDLDKDEAIEVVTPGRFLIEEDCFNAVYEESKISGMEGTITTLKITKNKLSLKREGTTETTMEFEKGERCICLYNTPYGMLNLHIDTKEIDVNIDENGGKIYVKYLLTYEEQPGVLTELIIRINAN